MNNLTLSEWLGIVAIGVAIVIGIVQIIKSNSKSQSSTGSKSPNISAGDNSKIVNTGDNSPVIINPEKKK